jgi:flagellar protein FlaG
MSIQAIGTQASAAIAAQLGGKSAPANGTAAQPAESAAAPVAPATPEKQRQEIESATKAVREFVQPITNNLEFSIDDDTGKTVVKVMDTSTKEVIRQIPSEEILEIARALDRLQGILLRQKA